MSHNPDKCGVPDGVIGLFCLISCFVEKVPLEKKAVTL
jgi:hypothetical protein